MEGLNLHSSGWTHCPTFRKLRQPWRPDRMMPTAPTSSDPPFRWAVIPEDPPGIVGCRFIIRKGQVAHREIRRVALTFEEGPYRWFRIGEEAFMLLDEAQEQADRLNAELNRTGG